MNRRDLIKGIGALGIGSVLPGMSSKDASASTAKLNDTSSLPSKYKGNPICWLTPQKTEGPYYLDSQLVRSDIRISTNNNVFHDGIPLNMNINVIDINCNPVANVLVDVWHCDKDGIYSGFNQPGGNYVGHNFMRGVQVSDTNGAVSFITSYPGWYNGRATHIHFKVRLNSTTYVTSQFCFLDSVNNTVHVTPLYAARGINPTTNQLDNIFNNPDPQYLRMTAGPNGNGSYDGTYTIGINNPTFISEPEFEADGYSLEQNYPNPFNPNTIIAYSIPKTSEVKIIIYDVFGKEVETIVNARQSAGRYEVSFNGANYASGYYFYKITAGEFERSREMLLIK
jgi:protocatechuate 3,4-dioxygenase beta subunit